MVRPMAAKASIGARLRKLRVRNGFSQKTLAEAILVSRETIRNWENDFCEPPCGSLKDLSILYHVTTDYILGLSNKKVICLDQLSPEQEMIVVRLVSTFEKKTRKAGME